jgi:hypothetical protein
MNLAKIAANFILDETGKPRFTTARNHNHYSMLFHIETPPPDTYAVTYYLHETYFDPVREIRDAASAFAFQTTSYGDYTVTAKIRTKSGSFTLKRRLYQALEESCRDITSPEIQRALQDIRDN